MKFYCIGFNHQSAPVEIREKVAFNSAEIVPFAREVLARGDIRKLLVLSTCNRVELYAVTMEGEEPLHHLKESFFHKGHGHGPLGHHLYVHEKEVAVRHLFEVVSGLNSMVLGETEIFGQVKQAYETAMTEGFTGKVLNRVFQKAFQAGKHVRSHTGITRGNVSVGSVAVTLAEKIFDRLENLSIMVIGAGEISERTARAFQLRGAAHLTIVNRSLEKAQVLAAELGGKALPLDGWLAAARDADIIVSSTSSPEYVVHQKDIDALMRQRPERPLFLIDLAVPRDIDPAVNWIENCYLYNIDDLSVIAEESSRQREQELARCLDLVREKTSRMASWLEANL